MKIKAVIISALIINSVFLAGCDNISSGASGFSSDSDMSSDNFPYDGEGGAESIGDRKSVV